MDEHIVGHEGFLVRHRNPISARMNDRLELSICFREDVSHVSLSSLNESVRDK